MIKLIACDMDAALLGSEKRLPQGLLNVLRVIRARLFTGEDER